MLRSVKELHGYQILAKDGEVGSVADFLFDDQKWWIRYVLVDTGRWLEGRKVLLSPVSIEQADWTAQAIKVALKKEQVESSPEIDTEQPVSRQKEVRLHQHYKWPYYWTSAPLAAFGGTAILPLQYTPEPDERAEEKTEVAANPHLRSTKEVCDYHIQAADGEIGHVEDFIINDETWLLRYMVVDTKNWLLIGRKVLISPQWIQKVSWADANVHVYMAREQVKASPEFDPSAPINREYEERLYDFYGRPTRRV